MNLALRGTPLFSAADSGQGMRALPSQATGASTRYELKVAGAAQTGAVGTEHRDSVTHMSRSRCLE